MAGSQAPQFQHEPFGDDRSQIRLVQVLPHLTQDGLIQLSMMTYPFRALPTSDGTNEPNTTPVYSCLSYTWGDEVETQTICINGLSFRVRHNLWMFLVAARKQCSDHGGLRLRKLSDEGNYDTYGLHRSCDICLWIDALCIGQSNNSERGHQVQRMSEIYKGAQLVLIWLSLNSDDESVLQQIHQFEHRERLKTDTLIDELVAADSMIGRAGSTC